MTFLGSAAHRGLCLAMPVAVGLLLLPPLLRAFPSASGAVPWALELASHWQWLALALLLAGALLGACLDRRWLLALLGAALPWWTAAPALPAGSGRALDIVTANVHFDNRDPFALIRWLDAQRPDLVLLLEVSPAFAEALRALGGYSHRLLRPSSSAFGIALLSRLPILASDIVEEAPGIPRIDAVLDFAGCPIRFTALHPMPPLSSALRARLDAQLQAAARRGQASGRPALLAGDLNTTPWAATFVDLQRLGWRRATGLAPTWGGWLGVPIDHVLASPHWRLIDRARGPRLGSDHRAQWVRLGLPEGACPGVAPTVKPLARAAAIPPVSHLAPGLQGQL